MTNATESIDPMVLTYKLMEIQRVAEASLSSIKDNILVELSAQAATSNGRNGRNGRNRRTLRTGSHTSNGRDGRNGSSGSQQE